MSDLERERIRSAVTELLNGTSPNRAPLARTIDAWCRQLEGKALNAEDVERACQALLAKWTDPGSPHVGHVLARLKGKPEHCSGFWLCSATGRHGGDETALSKLSPEERQWLLELCRAGRNSPSCGHNWQHLESLLDILAPIEQVQLVEVPA